MQKLSLNQCCMKANYHISYSIVQSINWESEHGTLAAESAVADFVLHFTLIFENCIFLKEKLNCLLIK